MTLLFSAHLVLGRESRSHRHVSPRWHTSAAFDTYAYYVFPEMHKPATHALGFPTDLVSLGGALQSADVGGEPAALCTSAVALNLKLR